MTQEINSNRFNLVFFFVLCLHVAPSFSWPAIFAGDQTLTVNVVDAYSAQPIPARLYLTSETGTAYYFSTEADGSTAVRYEKQNWIDKQSVEYHTTVSAGTCFAKVPSGRYTLVVEHGKSYRSHSQDVTVAQSDIEVLVALKRWSDPASLGWYSGDTHLHRTIHELRNVVLAEDLNVALPLTQWVTLSDTQPAGGNKSIEDAKQSGLIQVDDQHVIWPRNTEYEIFSVGKERHTLGALFVLGHSSSLAYTVPPWKPVIDAAQTIEPNTLLDMDKLDWPFAMLLPTLAPSALYELSNNHVWRSRFAFRTWNTPAPDFLQPPFGGAAGGHRQWIDYTHGMYYTLLNCGLRLPPSAGTANGVHPVPAGFGRVYVHMPDGFRFDAWMRALKQGRSFITTGPMLYATANGMDPGHVFQCQSDSKTVIQLKIRIESEEPLLYGELIVNGRPEMLLTAKNDRNSYGAFVTEHSRTFVPQRSGWLAVRFWEKRADGQVRFAHSAPWYVEVDQRPVAIEAYEKEYLIDRMRREIARSNGIVSPEAMQEYRDGLAFYQNLPERDDTSDVDRNARPDPSPESASHWLDNMIIDHGYNAHEVRWAIGLTIDQAQREIGKRIQVKAQSAPGLRLRPYPGGRHPRRGFLDGAVDPQRETKVSLFPPWKDGGYVVIDLPEAIFSNLGLTYLAHTHIPTLWDKQQITLPKLEWSQQSDRVSLRRELPNGIAFSSHAELTGQGVAMKVELTNGTEQPLTGLRVQVCTMLKAAVGFNSQEPLETVIVGSTIAVKAAEHDRWIITQFTPNQRVWTNPPVPCIHSDPIFPDCMPRETVSVVGWLKFYEGPDVRSQIPLENTTKN